MQNTYDIAIVGGGASGLMAAVSAYRHASTPPRIAVLERLDRVGKKLLATGNGRCNLTNLSGDSRLYGKNKAMLREVQAAFCAEDALRLFRELGLECTIREEGRVYPWCMQASAVLEVLRNAVRHGGVEERVGAEITGVRRRGDGFLLSLREGETVVCRKLILAAGGQAMPSLGSNGSGYALARELGHTVTRTFPALVALKSEDRAVAALNGIRANAEVCAMAGERALGRETGEVQFTQSGLSGIPVMQLSRLLNGGASTESKALVLDFLPDIPREKLRAMLEQRARGGLFATLETFMLGLTHKKIGYAVLSKAGLKPFSRQARELKAEELDRITEHCKAYTFSISGSLGWESAQVTAGGVDSREFCAGTLESDRVPGLYAVGELLDVYGDCGGYNLQWAWATGFLAGKNAAIS